MANIGFLSHLTDTQTLQRAHIKMFFQLAQAFQKADTPPPFLKEKTIGFCFSEPSTRTYASFWQAVTQLGGRVLNLPWNTSSAQKGESLSDTLSFLSQLSVDAFVMRHFVSAVFIALQKKISVPLINAGDGMHAHPSQALLDYGVVIQGFEKRNIFQPWTRFMKGACSEEQFLKAAQDHMRPHVVFIGDIIHSRVAHSGMNVFLKMGFQVSVCAPYSLIPKVLPEGVGVEPQLTNVLPQADVVITLRVQKERHAHVRAYPSEKAYAAFWGLKQVHLSLLKKQVCLLDPGPIVSGVQMETTVLKDPRSEVLAQVRYGLWMRMSILSLLCAPKETLLWLKTQDASVSVLRQ